MRDIALFLILLPLIPLTLRFAQVGVLLWTWIALLAPNEYLYGFLREMPLNKIIAIVTIPAILLSREKKNYRFNRTLIVMVALLSLGTVSAFESISNNGLNWDLYGRLTKMLVLAYAVSIVMDTRVRLHALVCTVCLAIAFEGTAEGLKFMISGSAHKILGTTSMGDNNSFALGLLMVIPLLYYLYSYSVLPIIKLGWLAGLILCFVAVIGSFSRGALVGVLAMALIYVTSSRRKVGALLLMGGVALLIFALAPPDWFGRMSTIESADEDSSFLGRVTAWKMSTLVALDRPIYGGGFHAIQTPEVWVGYIREFQRLDFIPSGEPDALPHAAHSIYFEVLGDLGFGGLLLFLSLLFFAFQDVRTVKRLTKSHPRLGWAYNLAIMLQLSLIAYCVSGAALSVAYFETIYIVLAILPRLRSIVEREIGSISTPAEPHQRLAAQTADLQLTELP